MVKKELHPIYFAKAWSAKFILQKLGVQNLFCKSLECKIYFATAKIDNDPFFGNALWVRQNNLATGTDNPSTQIDELVEYLQELK